MASAEPRSIGPQLRAGAVSPAVGTTVIVDITPRSWSTDPIPDRRAAVPRGRPNPDPLVSLR